MRLTGGTSGRRSGTTCKQGEDDKAGIKMAGFKHGKSIDRDEKKAYYHCREIKYLGMMSPIVDKTTKTAYLS